MCNIYYNYLMLKKCVNEHHKKIVLRLKTENAVNPPGL